MNIYDLPIPNFGELSNEQALELILEVRSRRRFVAQKQHSIRKEKVKLDVAPRAKRFNTPFGKFTKEELAQLLATLK